jgi:hypothetical protein
MRSVCFIVCLCTALTIDIAQADQTSAGVASQGETLVVANGGKSTVQVKIKTHEINIGKSSDPRPTVIESSCTYSKYPCSIVDRLDILVNGRPLFVPRSAFADIADLNKAEITITKSDFILKLDGGDASEGYIAKLEFNAIRVKRRTLASGTLPDQPLQETIYHVVVEGK